jgi:hypothetical protein
MESFGNVNWNVAPCSAASSNFMVLLFIPRGWS